ncbi:HIT family protein [Candidatus Saccharibacteria bacterium]|nr:HIT family protein [Candidatus Saccharibacteria bacterium]
MEESIFTKIIKGEIPCHKVYEDEFTFGFMDIHPIQPGHVLLVSKRQVTNFFDLSDEEYQGLMAATKKMARHMSGVFPDKKRIGVMIEGLDVDHVHVKLFPVDTGEQFRHEPDMNVEPDHDALADMAKRLSIT